MIDISEKAELEGRFFYHELFTPHLFKRTSSDGDYAMKYIGNAVIPGRHVKSIVIDHRLQGIKSFSYN